MSIKLNNNFEITSWLPIDTRFLLSQAEMRTMNDNRMPDKYFTICKEDGKIYLYDKSATSEGLTGKFKVLSEDVLDRLDAIEAELLNCVKKNDYDAFKTLIENRMTAAETNITAIQEDIQGVGKYIDVKLDQDNYKVTVSLLDKNRTTVSSGTIDLPIEKLLKSARFDKAEKALIFICEDNTEFSVSIASLVSDLASKAELLEVKNLIPTKTSELTNDSGFLTAHQSLAEYRKAAAQDAIDAGKQNLLVAGSGIKIEGNVISATGGGSGEPAAYLKSASVNGNTLTLTNKDNTTVLFTPTGGGSYVAGENITIEGNVISAVDTVYDDTEVRNLISNKVDKPVEPVVGQGVNVPYFFDVNYSADKVTVRDYTVDLLDKNKTPGVYSLDVNAATTEKAGLMSAADKDKLNKALTEHQSLVNYSLITETGNKIELELDNATYILTAKLKDKNGTLLSSQSVDLPLEQVVVSGRYDAAKKALILELKNGNIIEIPISDLISGLVSQSDFDTYKEEVASEFTEINTKLAEKQAKLTVGDNISITNNIISAVDTKYTAGENITIVDNVISAIGGGILQNSLTTNITVGGITSGTTFAAGTSLEAILRKLLITEVPTGNDIYFGAMANLPTSASDINNLTKEVLTNAQMTAGVAKNISTVSEDTGRYVVIAYKSAIGTITSITEDGLEAISDFSNQFTFGDYKFYCTANEVYDPEAEINYVIKWSIN